jgi:prepilin-type N-terminal cleavage/methylation domain-containing protein
MNKTRDGDGFSLVELLTTVVISTLVAMAVIPQLQQRLRQASVDAYTNRLEAGINQLKANMIGRQDSCEIIFPNGAGGEVEISSAAIESLQIDTQGEESSCPQPRDMNGMEMPTTELRLISIKRTHTMQQGDDIRLLISTDAISMSTVGGVAAPDSTTSHQPLIIRIRSQKLHQSGKGFERCLQLEPMTGTLIRGTWVGGGFGSGSCMQNQ